MIENINLNGATVSAELHGYMYSGIYGYNGVMDYGSNISATIVSNNEIKLADGLICNVGRFMRIVGSESVKIANGSTGVTRKDLIVAHFETNGITETHDIRVIQGVSGGTTPSYTNEDIYNGGKIHELPLYEVSLNGLTVEKVTAQFEVLHSTEDLRNNISNHNIIVNSNFVTPVNTNGKTSYTGSDSSDVYTIDRWQFKQYSKSTALTFTSNGIKLANTGSSANYFNQKFEDVLKGTFTFSCNVKSLSGKVRIYGENSKTSATVNGVDLKAGLNYFTTDGNVFDTLVIMVSANSTVEIEWVKLESGSIPTSFSPRSLYEEKQLCNAHALTYEEIQASTDLTGKVSSAQAFSALLNNQNDYLPDGMSIIDFISQKPNGIILALAKSNTPDAPLSSSEFYLLILKHVNYGTTYSKVLAFDVAYMRLYFRGLGSKGEWAGNWVQLV